MKPQNLELLQDRFQSRLDKLTPEQAEAGAQAVQQGATLASTYRPAIALTACTASWPDGNRLAIFKDMMTQLEIELVMDEITAVLNGQSPEDGWEYAQMVEAGAETYLVLAHGGVGAAVWIRAGHEAMLIDLLDPGEPAAMH